MAAPVAIATDRSPGFSLPLRHFLMGIASIFLALLGVTLFGGELTHATWTPHLLALTHLLALGGILAVIMGACYQLVPVVLLARIWSEPLGKGTFWVYLAGTLAMVSGFWSWQTQLLGLGAALVLVGIAAFLCNVAVSLLKASWSKVGAFLIVALAMLVAAGAVGGLRVLGYAAPGLAVPLFNAMVAHAHLAAFGCATLLIFGISYQLVPMFAVAHSHDRLAWPVLGLGTLGVLAVAGGSLAQSAAPVKLGATLMVASSLLWGHDVWRMYQGRTRKQLDVGLAIAYSSLLYLAGACVLGLLLAWGAAPPIGPAERLMAAYGVVSLGGWITLSILGWFFKIMPFLAWYHRYSALVGKKKVPLVKDIYDERLGWVSFGCFHASIIILALSLLAGQGLGVQLGGAIGAAGALAVVLMLTQVLRR